MTNQPASTAPLAAGLPLVQGKCPACAGSSLFLGNGGYVTCSRLDCPEPDAASTLLEQPAAVSAAVAPPTQTADEVDADTVANRAAQVITTMGAEIRELKRERDRYRMAWHNARRRAGVLSAEVTRRAPLLGEYATEIARLRRELAASEGIRENADFHLGQEMARRQRAEKEAAALRRMADETATETQRRCPSCDHEAKYHAADDGRCWFTVDHGVPGANLVCPCIPRDPGDDEPAAGARQDGAES